MKREPELDLLLRGDLIALSPLGYEEMRDRMMAALRERLRDYTLRDAGDPGVAIVEALAACLEVMGFYHDRILTESKLGSALTLSSVARLGAAVGYRPSPPLAAVACQFFLAAAAGVVPAGTRVAGRGGDPPVNVIFETRAAVSIAPAYNRMALSPLLTRYAGALRAIVTRRIDVMKRGEFWPLLDLHEHDGGAEPLPLDDFRAGALAMINSKRGIELCPIAGGRRRGVAFEQPLLRSYDAPDTVISRATRLRHLRFWQALGADPDPALVVFEVTDRPILHLPDPAAPEVLRSTLEVFVFDTSEPVPSTSAWDPGAAWTEVPDFSASEASDRHYRVIVDDRLTTYIVLRRKLGYRTLLDDRALGRVYVRYTPAIGRLREVPSFEAPPVDVPAELAPGPIAQPVTAAAPGDLDRVTMGLDAAYFMSALVRPRVKGRSIRNEAGWAVTSEATGLGAGDQIAVLGGASGDVFVRTLAVGDGQYLQWAPAMGPSGPEPRPVDEHEPIRDVFDSLKGAIAPLADVARGQMYPLWEAFYKQARVPDTAWRAGPAAGTEIPERVVTGVDVTNVEQVVYLHKGSTFLLLEDASHVKAGDYLLVGRRLKQLFRKPEPRTEAGGTPATEEDTPPTREEGFNTHAPWLTAEVVQAVEVQGNLVRLKEPVGQDYYLDRRPDGAEITEVIVVPRVASVYYGDHFTQEVQLTSNRTFISVSSRLELRYIRVALTGRSVTAEALRERLGWAGYHRNKNWTAMFDQLFLAVAGEVAPLAVASWSYHVRIPSRGLKPENHINALEIASSRSTISTSPPTLEVVGDDVRVQIASDERASMAYAAYAATEDFRVAIKPELAELTWRITTKTDDELLVAGEFRVSSEAGFYFLPDGASPIPLDSELLRDGGTLLIEEVGGASSRFPFRLRLRNGAPSSRGLLLEGGHVLTSDVARAVAISRRATFPMSAPTPISWVADWSIPDHFEDHTGWISHDSSGVMILQAGGVERAHRFARSSDDSGFELRDVPITPGQPLDPLHGVTTVWALPDDRTISITPADIIGVWSFKVDPSAAARLGASWSGPLVMTGERSVAFRRGTLVGSSDRYLRVALPGDIIDLRSGEINIHALHPEPASSYQESETLVWTGSPLTGMPSSASSRNVALTFDGAPTGAVQVMGVWWDPEMDRPRLLQLTDGPLSSGTRNTEYSIDRIFLLHHKFIPIVSTGGDADDINIRLEGERTHISFVPPPDWPSTPLIPTILGVINLDAGSVELRTAAEYRPPEGGSDEGELIFEGDLTDSWTGMFLTTRDWSGLPDKTALQVGALRVSHGPWDAYATQPGIGLLFVSPALADTPGAILLSDAKHVAAIATIQGNSLWVAPRDPGGSFQDSPAQIYLSLYSEADVELGGTTHLRVGALPDDKLGFAGIQGDTGWRAYRRSRFVAIGSDPPAVLIAEPLPELFPGAIPANINLRFAYDVAASTPGVDTCTGIRSLVKIPRATLVSAGVSEPVSGANAAALHDGGDLDPADIFSLQPGSTLPDARTWALEPSIGPEAIFGAESQPRFSSFSFAQSWSNLDATSIAPAPLEIELSAAPYPELLPGGKVLDLKAGDELLLLGPAGQRTAPIIGDTTPGVYEVDAQEPPTEVRLNSLRVKASDFESRLSIPTPTAEQRQDPWLLTFSRPRDAVTSIAGSLLRYAERRESGGQIMFTFDAEVTETILENRGRQIHCYTNEARQLRRDLYTSTISRSPLDQYNFLKSSGDVEALLASIDSPSFRMDRSPPPSSVLICSKTSSAVPDGTLEFGVEDRFEERIQASVFSESIVFNSGDFIPVLGTGVVMDNRVIRNALRVWVGVESGELILVTYEPALSNIVEDIEQGSYAFDEQSGDKYLYSFNKVPGGTFTLNFLLIGYNIVDHPRVTVFVEYSAPRVADPNTEAAGRIYQFETPLDRLQPDREIVTLDSGDLKPDDYLFLHTATDAPSDPPRPLQWTRVRSITGPLLTVDPPLPPLSFVLEQFRRYTLNGFSKPARPAALDKEYYAQLNDAELDPASLTLPLGDRLVINPRGVGAADSDDAAHLRALVPGDRLLVWEEDHRIAWSRHRLGLSGPEDTAWAEWPDYQHEAVVKKVDPATGLVILSEPLPERFALRFADDAGALTLTPETPTLRALPHYRAPFQGDRKLMVLGSGDKARRFARYTGTLDPDPGVATLPISRAGAYAGNIEVLTREPKSGEWSRWIQLADIDRAGRKDRAFVLGIDAAAVASGRAVPFSVSFGDGTTGQVLPTGTRNVFARSTAIGGWAEHMPACRPLRILSVENARAPFEVPPDAAAAPVNLKLVVEAGDPEQWSPAPGEGQWRPAMEVLVDGVAWREIDRAQACQGYDGVYVRGLRPGALEVFFFSQSPVASARVEVRKVPEARVWALDSDFYTDLAGHDLTRAPGARRLQLLETEGLGPGSLLAASRGEESQFEMARIDAVDHDTWSATLAEPLAGTYALETAFLRGNLVDVVQGNAERAVLGSGDGGTRGLRLPVYNRAPLLHVVTEGSTDPEPSITVLVDGQAWSRVADLDTAGPRDRVWRLDLETDGSAFVTFGDGIHGAVPPAGNNNIEGVLHTGDGEAGNLPAGAIDKLRDGNLAVKATWNVTAATGGRRGETAAEARETLLGRSVGFERVVSADDAARVALEVGEVLHARVDPTAPRGALRLVVALAKRRAPTESILEEIRERIAARMPATAGVELEVVGAEQVAIHMVVEITAGPGHRQSDVLAALGRAFGAGPGGFFAAERWPVGEPLRLGDVYEAVFAVPGVSTARVTWMSTGEPPPSPAGPPADSINPGPRGVIRCDTDPLNDPSHGRGTVRFAPAAGGSP
ncbi:baseplate J/gp47 family protein [Sorangium sp. So ce861]|uniref:baseplate J/gp47 family protein n=1 Tax=Sorangium sp. So ce861 TaxID=3133323 RepID=UPI003F62CA87